MRDCLKWSLSLIIFFLQVIYWVVVKTSRNVLWNENVFHHSQKCTLYVSLHQNPWKSSFKLFHKHGWKRSTFGFKCRNQETQREVEMPHYGMFYCLFYGKKSHFFPKCIWQLSFQIKFQNSDNEKGCLVHHSLLMACWLSHLVRSPALADRQSA